MLMLSTVVVPKPPVRCVLAWDYPGRCLGVGECLLRLLLLVSTVVDSHDDTDIPVNYNTHTQSMRSGRPAHVTFSP